MLWIRIHNTIDEYSRAEPKAITSTISSNPSIHTTFGEFNDGFWLLILLRQP